MRPDRPIAWRRRARVNVDAFEVVVAAVTQHVGRQAQVVAPGWLTRDELLAKKGEVPVPGGRPSAGQGCGPLPGRAREGG